MKVTSLRRHVLAALAISSMASGIGAAAHAENLTPQVLLRFDGYTVDNNAASATPQGTTPAGYQINGRAPVLGADGKLHGFTSPASTFAAYGDPGYYEVALDGTGYKWISTGNSLWGTLGDADGGQAALADGNLLTLPDGTLTGRSSQSLYNKAKFTGGAGGGFFNIANGVVTSFDAVDANTGTALYVRNDRPFGQAAQDSKGNVYYSTATAGTRGKIWRMNAGDQKVVKLVDLGLAAYDNPANPGSTSISLKGSLPQSLIWSESEQALYVLVGTAGDATQTVSGTVNGTLLRVKAADFITDGTGTSTIEVMHNFDPTTDGAPGDTSWPIGMVEDGDWIYFVTINGGNVHGDVARIMRYKKGCVSTKTQSCLAVVHTFANDNAGTASADAAFPNSLVLAADGYIYGTAQRTADTTGTYSGRQVATGAGALFRIKPGSAADRSDDAYEVIHRFDLTTDGGMPTGLSLGKSADGTQTIYGATRYGGNGASTMSIANPLTMLMLDNGVGAGTLFSFEVDAPKVSFTTELTATSRAVTVGDSINLSWEAKNAAVCTASGAWEGAQNAANKGLPVTVANAGDNVYTLTCEDKNGGKVDSSVTVTAAASTSGGDTSTGGTGSAGSDTSVTSGGGGGGGGALGYGMLGVLGLLGALRRRVRG